jgi:NACalpha-BTF3-like transcription factor
MSSFFDYLNAINTSKVDLMKQDPLSQKDYVPFMINRGLSHFADTVMYANEMNRFANIPKDWQFAFYLNSISKKKRFSKWHKKDQNSADMALVMKAYNYSSQKAIEALELLTPDQLENLRSCYETGGR